MARGGRRQGAPGASYQNRTDLNQPVRTATDQPYGQATQQARAQRAVPLPQVNPGDFGPFDRPTDRPGEPVTAGIPLGPGPGTEAIGQPALFGDDRAAMIRAAYQVDPNNDLLRLLDAIDNE